MLLSRKPLSYCTAETAEFRESRKCGFQRCGACAKPCRCWGSHSLTYFKFRILKRPQVGYAPGSTLQVDGISFELKQFHFHAPSENLIKGKSYPLEGHLVHVNSKGEIAVVAVMYEAGKANTALTEAFRALPAKVGEIQPLSSSISAEQLLPKRRDYYRFSGSLTTPPCSEGVRWLVMKQPVEVSQTQIDAFKAVMHTPNNRPVQALNGRVVLQ